MSGPNRVIDVIYLTGIVPGVVISVFEGPIFQTSIIRLYCRQWSTPVNDMAVIYVVGDVQWPSATAAHLGGATNGTHQDTVRILHVAHSMTCHQGVTLIHDLETTSPDLQWQTKPPSVIRQILLYIFRMLLHQDVWGVGWRHKCCRSSSGLGQTILQASLHTVLGLTGSTWPLWPVAQCHTIPWPIPDHSHCLHPCICQDNFLGRYKTQNGVQLGHAEGLTLMSREVITNMHVNFWGKR